jgi:hypothetical protein
MSDPKEELGKLQDMWESYNQALKHRTMLKITSTGTSTNINIPVSTATSTVSNGNPFGPIQTGIGNVYPYQYPTLPELPEPIPPEPFTAKGVLGRLGLGAAILGGAIGIPTVLGLVLHATMLEFFMLDLAMMAFLVASYKVGDSILTRRYAFLQAAMNKLAK